MTCVPCGSFWVSSFASSHFAPFVAARCVCRSCSSSCRESEMLRVWLDADAEAERSRLITANTECSEKEHVAA